MKLRDHLESIEKALPEKKDEYGIRGNSFNEGKIIGWNQCIDQISNIEIGDPIDYIIKNTIEFKFYGYNITELIKIINYYKQSNEDYKDCKHVWGDFSLHCMTCQICDEVRSIEDQKE